jgi:hypothetical protein
VTLFHVEPLYELSERPSVEYENEKFPFASTQMHDSVYRALAPPDAPAAAILKSDTIEPDELLMNAVIAFAFASREVVPLKLAGARPFCVVPVVGGFVPSVRLPLLPEEPALATATHGEPPKFGLYQAVHVASCAGE